MSEYGKKLMELRTQINKRASLEDMLDQLNRKKSQTERQMAYLEPLLDKAAKNVDRYEKGGIFSLFSKEEKRESAYRELSDIKSEYFQAKNALDRLNFDIQKTFNRMSEYSDSQRMYDNLMAEVKARLDKGNNRIITTDEIEYLQKAEIKAKIQQLKIAVAKGGELTDMIDGFINLSSSQTISNFSKENLRIAIMKFRTSLKDTDKSSFINLKIESDKRLPYLRGYDPLARDRYCDMFPTVNMAKPLSAQEMIENLAEVSHNIQHIIDKLNEEIKQLESLL